MGKALKHPYMLVLAVPFYQLIPYILIYRMIIFPLFIVPFGINYLSSYRKLSNVLFHMFVFLVFNLAYFVILSLCSFFHSNKGRVLIFLLVWAGASLICSFYYSDQLISSFMGHFIYGYFFFVWFYYCEIRSRPRLKDKSNRIPSKI